MDTLRDEKQFHKVTNVLLKIAELKRTCRAFLFCCYCNPSFKSDGTTPGVPGAGGPRHTCGCSLQAPKSRPGRLSGDRREASGHSAFVLTSPREQQLTEKILQEPRYLLCN